MSFQVDLLYSDQILAVPSTIGDVRVVDACFQAPLPHQPLKGGEANVNTGLGSTARLGVGYDLSQPA